MRWFTGLFSLLMLGVIVAIGGLAAVVFVYSRDLPDYSYLKDYRPPILSRVYAGDGRLMATIAAEQRVFVPVEAIPKRVSNAFLSAEDKDFYRHGGIDPMGILRALLTNVSKIASDRRPVGASTITQQVAKNFLLTNEVSIARKVREAILARRIEQALSKDRILELYLNEIFLGQRSYGVAAAALNYFNKSLDELTIGEAAYLASLPKAPNNYNPVTHHDAALARRNWVIGRMEEDGHISQAEADAARAEPLAMRARDDAEVVTADYFSEEVRRELVGRFGEKNVLEGGLAVRTSLDPAYQVYATKALREGLLDYDRRQRGWRGPVAHMANLKDWRAALAGIQLPPGGEAWQAALVFELKGDTARIAFADGGAGHIPWAEMKWARRELPNDKFGPPVKKPADVLAVGDIVMVEAVTKSDEGKTYPENTYTLRQVPLVQGALVALDPHTGRVFAMSGGFSAKISQFNRATQAWRQPGSAFKPFVYLAALDKGFTPSSLVLDAPFSYFQGPGLPLWRPENYSEQFYGPTPLRVGLEKSRNVMTVRLANAIGMPVIVEYAKRFGVVDDMPDLLSFALGAKESTVLRMSTAYAMFVNGGKKITPTMIDRVQDRDGKTVWSRDNRVCPDCAALGWTPDITPPEIPDTREQVADPRTAYQLVSMLEGVCQRGTAARLHALGKPVAGKTGTTNDAKDAWFIGFTPDLVVGVFVGFDDPKPLGSRETGASVAVPVFQDFMQNALKDKPGIPFRVPSGLRLVRVNPETGRLADVSTTKAIWEAFIPGTEPGEGEPSVLDGSADASPGMLGMTPAEQMAQPVEEGGGPTAPVSPATTGTGGLY